MVSPPPNLPTIILIPAAFSGKTMYTNLITHLTTHGFPIIFASLPSIVEIPYVAHHDRKDSDQSQPTKRGKALEKGSVEPVVATGASMNDDATYIQSIVSRLVEDEGKSVVLVAHSYGGIPMTESLKEFKRSEMRRKGMGRDGGIVGLVYVTALVPSVGESLAGMTKGLSQGGVVIIDGDFLLLDPISNARTTFSDLPEEEGIAWAAKMVKHSAGTFHGEASYEAWRFIPVTYVLCEGDKAFPLSLQEEMVEKVEREAGKKVRVVKCGTGHCPNVSEVGREKILQAVVEASMDW